MDSKAPIAVLDSGIGGLTVWREIIKELPCESVIYYADSANCPYGAKDYDEIVPLTRRCVEALIAIGVKMVVVACNTMTAAAIVVLRNSYPDTIFVGMEPAIKPAAKITGTGVVGILATQATLKGELYRRTASTLGDKIKIIEVAGNGLVEFVENSEQSSEQCYELTRQYIEPMLQQGADCVVLGCTHYPFLSNVINEISQGRLIIIDPAQAVSHRVKSLLASVNMLNNGCGDSVPNYTFISTLGGAESRRVAQRAAMLVESLD